MAVGPCAIGSGSQLIVRVAMIRLQDDAVDAARQERLKENRLKRLQQQQQQSDSSHRSV